MISVIMKCVNLVIFMQFTPYSPINITHYKSLIQHNMYMFKNTVEYTICM